MKPLVLLCLLIPAASTAFSQVAPERAPNSPVFPAEGENGVASPNPVAPAPSAPQATTTDKIISEAPATVVVKPSNPFSGFRKVDKNGDGTLSLYELTNAFHKADANGDERLSLEEFQQDIVNQPLDEGGVPDEPRIIIQQVQEKPAPAVGQPTTKRPNANTTRRGDPSSTKRDNSRNENSADDGDELNIQTDENRRRSERADEASDDTDTDEQPRLNEPAVDPSARERSSNDESTTKPRRDEGTKSTTDSSQSNTNADAKRNGSGGGSGSGASGTDPKKK